MMCGSRSTQRWSRRSLRSRGSLPKFGGTDQGFAATSRENSAKARGTQMLSSIEKEEGSACLSRSTRP